MAIAGREGDAKVGLLPGLTSLYGVGGTGMNSGCLLEAE